MYPLISILIPAYNAQDYIQASVDSALAQSYPNIEVVVVDDGSKDQTLQVLRDIEAQDARVKVFAQANKGVMATRGVTIEKAQGELLFFLDADDTLPLDALSALYQHLVEYSLDISCGDYMRITNAYQVVTREKMSGILRGNAYAQAILTEQSTAFLCCKLYRATLFDALIYPLGLNYAEDKFCNLQVALKEPVVGYLPQVSYNYYRRDGSLSQQGQSVAYVIDYSYKVWEIIQHNPALLEAFVVSKLRIYCGYINKTSNKNISNSDWVKELYSQLTPAIFKNYLTPRQRFVVRCFRRRWSAPLGKAANVINRISKSISKRLKSKR